MSDRSNQVDVIHPNRVTDDSVRVSTRVGILVRCYPKLSETFILGEILGLEKENIPLHIFSLFPPSDQLVNPAVNFVKASVTTLANGDSAMSMRIIKKHLQFFVSHPKAYLSMLARILFSNEYGKIKDFWFAGKLATELISQKITHLHVHFISTPAAIGRIASDLCNITYSISAHAKDIYLSRADELAKKLHTAAFTVTCTQYNWVYLRSKTNYPEKIHCMYHGINLAPFNQVLAASNDQPTDLPLILSVGRLREKKGFSTLIAACKKLSDLGQPFECIIAGYGPEQDRLQLQIDTLSLQNQVKLVGKKSHPEIIQLYSRARVFTLPCRVASDGDRDGIPNVMLEAMAMGLPVVSTIVSGIPEVITHGENGLLLEPDDVAGLAAALLKLIRDPVACKAFGMKGRALIEQKFSTSRNLEILIGLLKQADQTLQKSSNKVNANATN